MVKKIIIAVFSVVVLFGCKADNQVYWEILSQVRDYDDYKVNMSYAYRFGGDTASSNKINNLIYTVIAEPLVDCDADYSIDSLVNYLYNQKSNDSILSRVYYELNSSSSVYEVGGYTSVMIFTYNYTGGANGSHQTTYLNFNSLTGDYINIADIIQLDDKLLDEVRRKFCILRDIPQNATIQESGMFISPAELPFSEQIGFTSEGVVFFYNLYEIAPRAMGTTEVVVPYEEVVFI